MDAHIVIVIVMVTVIVLAVDGPYDHEAKVMLRRNRFIGIQRTYINKGRKKFKHTAENIEHTAENR